MIEKGYTIPVLDHGYVRLVDWMGDDKRIVEAARISYKSPSKGEESDKKLLFFLYRHAHTSPFEQCNCTFNIKMPIFVMREFVRHRTFRLNETSARYREMPEEFYIPKIWRQQDKKNKQSSIMKEDFNPYLRLIYPIDENPVICSMKQAVEEHCKYSYQLYKRMLDEGIAREMARMVLPVNLYTEIYVNCDVRNLMHFFDLRLTPTAQLEIQQVAKAMFDIFKELYPWCAQAYEKFSWKLEEK